MNKKSLFLSLLLVLLAFAPASADVFEELEGEGWETVRSGVVQRTLEDGTGTGCVPVGSRLYLDSTAACSTVSPAGEKALCYALQKYGAYVTGFGGSPFAVMFEAPSPGLPGGSAADPYPGVGIVDDFYDLSHIPWAKLKVAPDCQCTPY